MLGLLYRAADALRRSRQPRDQGRFGEDVAHRYLQGKGCTVVARNYRPRSRSGEIDLVVWHGDTLVFVEVKTRLTAEYGDPEVAVDEEKQVRLRRAARDYAWRAGVDWGKTRFDIIGIVTGATRVHIEWTRDAFR